MTIVLELAFERLGRAVDAAERCEIIKALDWVMDTGFTIGIALGGVTVGLSEDLQNVQQAWREAMRMTYHVAKPERTIIVVCRPTGKSEEPHFGQQLKCTFRSYEKSDEARHAAIRGETAGEPLTEELEKGSRSHDMDEYPVFSFHDFETLLVRPDGELVGLCSPRPYDETAAITHGSGGVVCEQAFAAFRKKYPKA